MATPNAPTINIKEGIVDSLLFVPVDGYIATEHEYSINGGSNWSDCLSDFVSFPKGFYAESDLKVRVKALGVNSPAVDISARLKWTPVDISEQQAITWLDGSDASTIVEVSGKVDTWRDKTSNGLDAVQTASARRPTYTDNKVVMGGTSWMDIAGMFDSVGTGNLAIYGIYQRGTTGLECVLSQDNFNQFEYRFGGDGTLSVLHDFGGSGGISTSTDGLPLNTDGVAGWSRIDGFDDPSVSGDSTPKAVTPVNFNTDPATIGDRGTTGLPMFGSISEFFVWKNPTADEIAKFQSYSAYKWDALNADTTIVDSLPVSHAYKAAPPSEEVFNNNVYSFSFTPNPDFVLGLHEYSLNSGTTWIDCTSTTITVPKDILESACPSLTIMIRAKETVGGFNSIELEGVLISDFSITFDTDGVRFDTDGITYDVGV